MKKRTKYVLYTLPAVFAILVLWVLWGNKALQLNAITAESEYLPDAFAGYRIAHVSDLHNAKMGQDNKKLLVLLEKAEPDMIAITGDLIDSRRTDIDTALAFAAEAVKIAPCYYVPGNHEARITEYAALRDSLTTLGVTVLEDARVTVHKDGQKITIIGVKDPSFQSNTDMHNRLQQLTDEADSYTVLLSHRPELFDTYVQNGADLVLSGHAHGGQVRLPFTGGLIAPHQGLFPEYDSGLYVREDTSMIVSRGIGNSLFPLRFNNRPEVILITLQHT